MHWKTPLTIVLVLFLIQGSDAHDLKLGLFECYVKNDQLYLQVKLDREQLLHAVTQSLPADSRQDDFEEAIFGYIHQRLALSFDMRPVHLTFFYIEYDTDFIRLRAKITNHDPDDTIHDIAVHITCLTETVAGQENIIQFHLNEQRRSFRLNKKRPYTQFTYPNS
ncbi:DUF6702 family protein [Reichenbachiella sp. 5M10]|uniref:DUF6702 family protein n=1 Tax=Reichenbachiella sp. 5M10 TaxID=1889772 RepID=UPI00117A5E8A|nr:DUF6702 family protein [Reichenbachiella sp. 5M10]